MKKNQKSRNYSRKNDADTCGQGHFALLCGRFHLHERLVIDAKANIFDHIIIIILLKAM